MDKWEALEFLWRNSKAYYGDNNQCIEKREAIAKLFEEGEPTASNILRTLIATGTVTYGPDDEDPLKSVMDMFEGSRVIHATYHDESRGGDVEMDIYLPTLELSESDKLLLWLIHIDVNLRGERYKTYIAIPVHLYTDGLEAVLHVSGVLFNVRQRYEEEDVWATIHRRMVEMMKGNITKEDIMKVILDADEHAQRYISTARKLVEEGRIDEALETLSSIPFFFLNVSEGSEGRRMLDKITDVYDMYMGGEIYTLTREAGMARAGLHFYLHREGAEPYALFIFPAIREEGIVAVSLTNLRRNWAGFLAMYRAFHRLRIENGKMILRGVLRRLNMPLRDIDDEEEGDEEEEMGG